MVTVGISVLFVFVAGLVVGLVVGIFIGRAGSRQRQQPRGFDVIEKQKDE